MGLSDAKSEPWEVGKSKNKVKKDDADGEVTGCWIALRSIRSCITSRSKVDNSISGISLHGKLPFYFLYRYILIFMMSDSSFIFFFFH